MIADEDFQLVEKFVETRDVHSFTVLYDKHFKRVYHYVFSYIGNKEETEDILAKTFETLLEKLKTFRFESKVSTFILGIARFKVLQFFEAQKKKKTVNIDFELWDEIVHEDTEVESASDEIENTVDYLKHLNEKERTVVKLKFLEGLNSSEIGKKLGLTAVNVRVMQKRALHKLKTIFKKNG